MSTTTSSWSIWKKLLILPLFLAVGLEVLFIWIFLDETISPPRIINGQVDDAPRMASLFLGFIVGVLYLGYAMLLGVVRLLVERAQRPRHDRKRG